MIFDLIQEHEICDMFIQVGCKQTITFNPFDEHFSTDDDRLFYNKPESYAIIAIIKRNLDNLVIKDLAVYPLSQVSNLEITNLHEYKAEEDGHYLVNALVLPDRSYVLEHSNLFVQNGMNVYYYDNEEKSFGEAIILDEELEFHNILLSDLLMRNFNAENYFGYRQSFDIFPLCNLLQCFRNYNKEIYDTNINLMRCGCVTDKGTASFNRDMIYMALCIISYLLEIEDYAEATKILNEITSCNGFCKQVKHESPCGCSKARSN